MKKQFLFLFGLYVILFSACVKDSSDFAEKSTFRSEMVTISMVFKNLTPTGT